MMRIQLFGKALTLCLAMLLSPVHLLGQQTQPTRQVHEVKPKDTLYSIAQRYGVPLDQLYTLNPWARKQINPGDILIISAGELTPKEKAQPRPIQEAHPTYPAREEAEPEQAIRPEIRVALMLPLASQKTYVEFYEGFLMGINDLKKNGISIELFVHDIPQDETLDRLIARGSLTGLDLVFGGVNEYQIERIVRSRGYGHYVIPFHRYASLDQAGDRVIQINPPASALIARAADTFIRKYKSMEVCFVRRTEDGDDPFAHHLKVALGKAGIRYRVVNITSQYLGVLGRNTVVVPVSPSKPLLQHLLAQLDPNDACILFGYPQWQSYGDEVTKQMHKYGTTIYASFFFDPYQSDATDFLTKYHAWFNKKIGASYPKMAVLGYDLARYFIRSYAALGQGFMKESWLLPSDGLQSDLVLSSSGHAGGYYNQRFYFVRYDRNGNIHREAL